MADEKLNVGPEENPQLSLFDAGPEGAPAPDALTLEPQSMVNEKKLSFTPAVEISFIKPKNQRFIAVSIEGEQASPSLSQAQELRKLDAGARKCS